MQPAERQPTETPATQASPAGGVRVAYTHAVPPAEADAFVQAWTRCKRHAVALEQGLQEALLLRSAEDPTRFVTVTRWDSPEAWRAYWSRGVPDPEGDARLNERWIEVGAVRAPPGPASPGEA